MAVYPFYTEIQSSTRKTPTGVGMRSKDGNMITHIHHRDKGAITTPFTIYQYTIEEDGVLKCVTRVSYKGEVIKEHITDY